jgi:MYXO-CTERM domain-containing protein
VLVLSSNASTHTGAIAVSAGTLKVNGALPSSSAAVAAGATLGGSGVLSGNVSVASGGFIAAGNSIGSLGTGNISIFGNVSDEIDMNGGAPASFADLLNVTGNVTLDGASLNLIVSNAPAAPDGKYIVIANDGADPVTGTFATVNLPAGLIATIDYAFSGTDSLGRVGNGNDIAVTLVPEPASAMAAIMLAGAAGLRRRRSR